MVDLAMPPPPPPPASSTLPTNSRRAAPSTASGAPPRKQTKRAPPVPTAGGEGPDGDSPAGPPYICPTCSTSYSRLEYLRRHERRHADIRPFVCECGKGFSRSDVLSRHKKQCPTHLGHAEVETSSFAPKPHKPRKPGTGTRKRSTAGTMASASSSRNSYANNGGAVDGAANGGQAMDEDGAPRYDNDQSAAAVAGGANAQSSQGGFPFPSSSGGASANSGGALLPPAPYAGDGAYDGRSGAGYGQDAPMHSQVQAINAAFYPNPTSPEASNGLNSSTSSPRFAARDMARHGSGSGSRFGLSRKPAGLDPFARPNASGYGPEFWDALDPSAKEGRSAGGTLRSRGNSTANAAGAAAAGIAGFAPGTPGAPGFAYPAANEFANAAGNGADPPPPAPAPGPREPQRFSVNGPLSPFGSIALANNMSPYLSAFSNARDTPHVQSPSRGPGTPSTSANVFDWNMRPPAKPASQSGTARRESVGAAGPGATPAKRKRGDDGEDDDIDTSTMDADAAQLLETLRSLRNNGAPPPNGSSNGNDSNGNDSNGHASSMAQSSAPDPVAASAAAGGLSIPTVAVEPASSGANAASAQALAQLFDGGNVTSGPEAFLLRLQGGVQEMRAAGSLGPDAAMLLPSELTASGAGHASGTPLSALGNSALAAPPSAGTQALWESLGLGASVATPMSAGGSSLGWLMSPSIQQLISSLATPAPGDEGSYFPASSTVQTSHALAPSGASTVVAKAPSPSAYTTEDPAVFRNAAHAKALERAFMDVKNPFYIPPDLFRPCYAIQHWSLPPLTRLSMLALHSQQNLLKHFPIMHEPTFRLDTTPGCLAFATCMLGCHEAGRKWWAGEEVVPHNGSGITSISNAVASPDRLTRAAAAAPGKLLVDEEDGQELVKPVVMKEKTDMLMRTFAAKAKSEKDKVSVVQALMLFQANDFLSSDEEVRSIAADTHETVTHLAREAGFFDPKAAHAAYDVCYGPEDVVKHTLNEAQHLAFSYSFLPAYLPGCSDEEKVWRRWCDLAGRRRTAFLLLVMDTVAGLDSGVALRVRLDEVAHLPLPSPDTIWRAPTASDWRSALNVYKGPTFEEAIVDLLAAEGKEGVSAAKAHPSVFGTHGPFARLVMIVALLRGILHLLEGRAMQVPTPSPLERWMRAASSASPGSTGSGSAGGAAGQGQLDVQVEVFKRALTRWRSAWDQDSLCASASGPERRARRGAAGATASMFTSQTASGAVPLCDDALPFYWLAHVLLGHAGNAADLPLPRRAARDEASPVRPSLDRDHTQVDAPDFRTMLRFAKSFVDRGESASTKPSATPDARA